MHARCGGVCAHSVPLMTGNAFEKFKIANVVCSSAVRAAPLVMLGLRTGSRGQSACDRARDQQSKGSLTNSRALRDSSARGMLGERCSANHPHIALPNHTRQTMGAHHVHFEGALLRESSIKLISCYI